MMVKATVPSHACIAQHPSFLGDTPIVGGNYDAALTGTCPSPVTFSTAVGNDPWGYLS